MQYQCILGIDFMKESKLTLDFDQKSLIIPDNQIKQLQKMEKPVEIDLLDTKLGEGQKQKLRNLFNGFKGLFSDQPGLTRVLYHEIDTGDKGPVVSRPYRYGRVKQGIIDYHIEKMLQEGKIRPIQSPYASPVVLTRKNNDFPPDSPEAHRFAIDYRKLNAITKYPRYPLPVIDDLIINIPHTGVMSTLDLKSGYFQLAISPKDIEKTAFITRNGTFAFFRMNFGLSGVAPNFQKAIDIILKPVIGRFVLVFTLLRDAGLTLNRKKCHFARDKLKYLGLIVSKEGIETDNSKVKAITEMKPPKNKAPVLQLPNFTEQFNLFTDASGVGIGAVLNQNHRPIAFASRTLNKAERSYTVTERECLAVIWALNKFKTYFGSLPVKSNDYIYRWALKLSEFNIEWEHRPGVQNVVADVISRNPVGNMDGSQISCAALRALAINSREQLIREQREDPELGHIYRYLENPDDGSVNATVCEEVFEHSSHRLDIKHMKPVTYRPRANLTERVNRNLVQIIACFVEENHENWDRFLHEFAFALRTSVNETTNKTPAELFLDRKIITPFRKLINVTEGAEYVGRNIEKLFDEARQNMRKQHKNWGKYYNRKRREVNIKVNDLVLVQTHSISAAGRRVVGKFMPKFEGPYRVLEVRNNNLIIWKKSKRETVNSDQVRVYRPRQSDTISSDSHVETLYEGQRSSNRSSRSGPNIWTRKDQPLNQQGIKRAIPSSVPSRNYKYTRPNNPSLGSQSIEGPSHLRNARQGKPPTEGSKHDMTGQYDKARETRTTTSRTNRAAERKQVWSKQATAVRPCPYYLRSRVKQPEEVPEDRRSIGIESIPQNNIRRRSLSMEALDGDAVDRSE
ncbi:retrovirus-related Pol polyprotein from transposon 297 [Trichonephila clavipes]|uniref:Retrovirus-related Pol polyprotein from transposon 297 n=1 Tax=Trichonephila clavipes TaxID=2585209 RepID=A0A8X6RGK3_TRICX|nr:retrovirus-related Pol polyprotein from transposon 297 [Trichonephila clavipes]